MSDEKPTTLSLFISSPGDVGQERLIASKVIQRLDAEFGDNVMLDPYFWEYEPFSITKDYQAQIPPPSGFDIFICILWSRLGSQMHSTYTLPPDHERVANSGTEYEFVDAKLSHDTKQSPELLVWVNKTKVGVDDLDDPRVDEIREQHKKLKAFLDEWVKDQEEGTFSGAVNRYATRDEFEEKFEIKLRKVIQRRLGDRADELQSKPRWPGNPYRGLQAFEYRHASIYFGRTAAAAEAIDHLAERLTEVWREEERADLVFEEFASRGVEPDEEDLPSRSARAFLLIWGASGSGKSSLAKAGVLPTLVKSGAVPGVGEWRCAIMKPSDGGKNPFLALAHALVRGAETAASLEKKDLPEGLEVEFCPAALPELVQDKRSAASIAQALKEKPESASELVRGAVTTASAVLAEREKNHLRAAIERDRKAGRSEDAAAIEQRLAEYEPKRVCVALVLDQMEELFTGGYPESTLTAFFQVLDHLAASGRVAVIGTLRSEFFSRCLGKKDYQQILGGTLAGGAEQKLAPPRPHELGQMIRKPAQAAGVRFEETLEHGKLDERIRDAAVQEPDSLPLLEFCLEKLYEVGADDGLLEHVEYGIDEELQEGVAKDGSSEPEAKKKSIGQLEGVLEQYAEEVFTDPGVLKPYQQEPLHAVILQLATEGGESGTESDALPEIVRRTVAYEELILAGGGKSSEDSEGGETDVFPAKALVDAFIEARLFTSNRDAEGNRTVTVTHEALLRKWGRVNAWLGQDDDRRFLRVRARVAQKLKHWEDEGKDPGLLLHDGPELGEAEEQFREHGEAFSGEAGEYILASIAEKKRAEEEKKREEERRRKIKNVVIGALSVLVVLSMVGIAVSVVQKKRADTATSESNKKVREAAQKAWGSARQSFDIQNDSATGFARMAEALRYNEELPASMKLRLLNDDLVNRVKWGPPPDPVPRILPGIDGRIEEFHFNDDGTRIITISNDHSVRIWHGGSLEPIGDALKYEEQPKNLEISPDGKWAICWSNSQKLVRILNLKTGEVVGHPIFHENGGSTHSPFSCHFSENGKRLMTIGPWKSVKVWDVPTGELILQRSPISSAQLNRDGTKLIASNLSDVGNTIPRGILSTTTNIINISTEDIEVTLQHQADVRKITLSNDGAKVLITTEDGYSQVWSVKNGDPIGKSVKSGLGEVNFSPEGDWVVARNLGFLDGSQTQVFDYIKGEEIEFGDFSVNLVRFCPNNKLIAVFDFESNVVYLWNKNLRELISGPIECVDPWEAEFCDDGSKFITKSNDKTIQIWSVADDKVLPVSIVHDLRVNDVCFSPDGKMVLTQSGKDMVQLWSAETGGLMSPPFRHNVNLISLDGVGVSDSRFTPDGASIVTHDASVSGTLLFWKPVVALAGTVVRSTGFMDITFSNDGKRILAAGEGGVFEVAADSGELLGSPINQQGAFDAAIYSSDGNILTISSEPINSDRSLDLWSKDSGELLETSSGELTSNVKLSPNGTHALIKNYNDFVEVWRIIDGSQTPIKLTHSDGKSDDIYRENGKIESGYWSPDGSRILTVGFNRARLWTQSGVQIGSEIRTEKEILSVNFSPQGEHIFLGSRKKLYIYDTFKLDSISVTFPAPGFLNCMEMQPNSEVVATGCNDRFLRFWNVLNGELLSEIRLLEDVDGVGFSPDGGRIATWARGSDIHLYDAEGQIKIGPSYCGGFSEFLPDNSGIVTEGDGINDHCFRIWNIANGFRGSIDPEFVEAYGGIVIDDSGQVRRITIEERIQILNRIRKSRSVGEFSQIVIDRLDRRQATKNVEREMDWIVRMREINTDDESIFQVVSAIHEDLPDHSLVPFLLASIEGDESKARILCEIGELRLKGVERIPEKLSLAIQAAAYRSAGNWDSALRFVENVSELQELTPRALFDCAKICRNSGEDEKATKLIKELFRREEVSGVLLGDSGYSIAEISSEDAPMFFERAISSATSDYEKSYIYSKMGWARLLDVADKKGPQSAYKRFLEAESMMVPAYQTNIDTRRLDESIMLGLAISSYLSERTEDSIGYFRRLYEDSVKWSDMKAIREDKWPYFELIDEIRRLALTKEYLDSIPQF